MVWGLSEPSGFGDYFPHGDFVGWYERLDAHFDSDMTDEERANHHNRRTNYHYVVSRKFTSDRGPIAPHEFPAEFRLARTSKSLASLLMVKNRLLLVDETLKDLIESLDPGVHQFWPIQITMPKSKTYPVRYFGLVIGRFLDSFVPERSEYIRYGTDTDLYVGASSASEFKRLSLDRSVIGDAHLWRERRLINPEILMSDALQGAIKEKGLRIFRHGKMTLV